MADEPSHAKMCAFCFDRGTHALMFFKSPYTDIHICSDCLKIFYTILQAREPHVIVPATQTRQ